MADDEDLKVDHLTVPRAWAVGVILAISASLGSAGTALYKYGSLAGEFAILKANCGRAIDLTVPAEVPPAPRTPSLRPDQKE